MLGIWKDFRGSQSFYSILKILRDFREFQRILRDFKELNLFSEDFKVSEMLVKYLGDITDSKIIYGISK